MPTLRLITTGGETTRRRAAAAVGERHVVALLEPNEAGAVEPDGQKALAFATMDSMPSHAKMVPIGPASELDTDEIDERPLGDPRD
jgi:hypothetical protein